MAWGTRIDLTCAYRSQGLYPASAVPYAMVVIDRHGTAEQVATWKALPNRELTVMGASSRARAGHRGRGDQDPDGAADSAALDVTSGSRTT